MKTPSKRTIARLLKRCSDLRAEIARLDALPPRPSAYEIIAEAARSVFAGEVEPPVAPKVDIRATHPKVNPMPAKSPSFAALGRIYKVSRQRLQILAKQYGKPVLLDPNALQYAIHCKQPIIRILSDPAERKRIKSEISKLS